jgi:hypothetical protein
MEQSTMSHDDNIAKIEKEKYQEVWKHQGYRNWSPGCEEHQAALAGFRNFHAKFKTGPLTVCDYGCGEGWSVQYFNDQEGVNAWGVEHAPNAIKAAGILVYEDCLWEMPDAPKSDFAFCCDVMEHIPSIKVGLTLAKIAARTEQMAFFRIAFVDDCFGPQLLNKPLHLTVRDHNWWQSELHKHWKNVMPVRIRRSFGVFMCADARLSQSDASESTPPSQ